MFWIYLPAGLLWLKKTAMENEIAIRLFGHYCMFCKGDIHINVKKGFGAKLAGTRIKLDVLDVTSSFTVDMTESKLV